MSVDVRVHGLHFGCGFVRGSACFIGDGRHEWTGLAGVGCIKSHCHVCLQLFTSFQPNLSSASHHYLHLFPAPASHLLIMCKDWAPVLISPSLRYIAQTRCFRLGTADAPEGWNSRSERLLGRYFLSSLGGRLDIVEANIRGTLRIQVLQRRPKKTIGFVR